MQGCIKALWMRTTFITINLIYLFFWLFGSRNRMDLIGKVDATRVGKWDCYQRYDQRADEETLIGCPGYCVAWVRN